MIVKLGKIKVKGTVVVRVKEKEKEVAVIKNHNDVYPCNLENFLKNIIAYYTSQAGVSNASAPGIELLYNSSPVKGLPTLAFHLVYYNATVVQVCFYYCDDSSDQYTVTCATLNLEIAGYTFLFSTSKVSFSKKPCQSVGISWFVSFSICPGANFNFCLYTGNGVGFPGNYPCAYPSNASNSYGGSSFVQPGVSIGVSPYLFVETICTTGRSTGYNFALGKCGSKYVGYIYSTNLMYNGNLTIRFCVQLQEGCCNGAPKCSTPCQIGYMYEGLVNSVNQWLIWANCGATGEYSCLTTTYVIICLSFVPDVT